MFKINVEKAGHYQPKILVNKGMDALPFDYRAQYYTNGSSMIIDQDGVEDYSTRGIYIIGIFGNNHGATYELEIQLDDSDIKTMKKNKWY